jgi:uncharacterized protein YjbI with pentapeptide repeats
LGNPEMVKYFDNNLYDLLVSCSEKRRLIDWNSWRNKNRTHDPQLSHADLRDAFLVKANLNKINLSHADLSRAKLCRANLSNANLASADLRCADLTEADLTNAHLACIIISESFGMELKEEILNEKVRNRLRSFHFSFLTKLNQSKLCRANLRGANLSGVDLTGANIAFADLHGVNLTSAIIINSRLIKANMKRAIMIGADFSGSDMSGVCLDECNFSNWIIKGVTCTHIIRNGKRIDFTEGGFEKAFTSIEQTVELILELPFSDIGYYTGRIIEEAINQKYGEGTIILKGQTAISSSSTQYEFINFGDTKQLDEIQIQLSVLQDSLRPVIEQALENNKQKSIIGISDEIGVPLTQGLVVRPKEISQRLNERFMTMHPFLQKIIMTVQGTIK